MSRVLLPYVRAVPYALTGPATRVRESIASLLYSRANASYGAVPLGLMLWDKAQRFDRPLALDGAPIAMF